MRSLYTRTVAHTMIFISAIALTFFGLTFAANKSQRLQHIFGISGPSRPLASASEQCISQNDLNDVYFVSCGGFF